MDSIIKLQFEVEELPHIIINALENEKAIKSNLSKKYDNKWKFQFEGIQGSHYDVYTKKYNRVIALQLFTPDVLETIYKHMPKMDIEVKGQSVWFVQRYGIMNDKLAHEMFTAIEEFIPQFQKQLKSAQLIK